MSAILFDAPRVRDGRPTTTEIVTSYTDDGHGLPVLVILSNCDRDLRAQSLPRLEEPFERVLVGEDVRSYKLAHGHWVVAPMRVAPDTLGGYAIQHGSDAKRTR